MDYELKRKLLLALSERFSIKSIDIRDYLIENDKQTTAVSSSLNNLNYGDIFL